MLPWGMEDYDLWLRFLRLGVKAKKLEGKLVRSKYRFKSNSMMRVMLKHEATRPMLLTMHTDLLSLDAVLRGHGAVMNMDNETRKVIARFEGDPRRRNDPMFGYLRLWAGLAAEGAGEKDAARASYEAVLEERAPENGAMAVQIDGLRWQAKWRLGLLECDEEALELVVGAVPGLGVNRGAAELIDACSRNESLGT